MKEIEKGLFCRPVRDGDDPILFRLFVERTNLVLPPAISDAGKELLLKQQFLGFNRQIKETYPIREEYIIISRDETIGEWRLHRGDNEIRLISITLTDLWRGKGIGSTVIRHIQQESKKAAKPLTLSVACDNTRAISLYQKLGLRIRHEGFPYLEMVWEP